MSDKLKPETQGYHLAAEQSSSKYTERVRTLIESKDYESDTKGFYSRGTHSSAGEQVILYYNSHQGTDLPGEYFLHTYPPGPKHLRKEGQLDSFKWSDTEGPEELYPDKLDRIDSLLALFDPIVPKGADG
ncbi:hypothetical protein KW801_00350 [Candidatus Saccharibacteria bacterium]|nr:hypothetical protein [Candidatus Saccharibacteria bacterium]